MSVIILTTGVPGCGKTYVRAARFLVDDFLINSHGVHISNFPLNREEIAKEVSSRMKRRSLWYKLRHKVSEEDLIKRMQIIPDDVLQSWKREESGPWDYFSGVNLKYAHIALDEVHNFVSEHSSEDYTTPPPTRSATRSCPSTAATRSPTSSPPAADSPCARAAASPSNTCCSTASTTPSTTRAACSPC